MPSGSTSHRIEAPGCRHNAPVNSRFVGCGNQHPGGGSVKHVVVSDVHHSITHTKIALQIRGEVKELDSRPSDALALAVQEEVPIFAEERVLDQAAWVRDKERNLFIPLEQERRLGPERNSRVRQRELQRLSACTEFIDTLDLGDFG